MAPAPPPRPGVHRRGIPSAREALKVLIHAAGGLRGPAGQRQGLVCTRAGPRPGCPPYDLPAPGVGGGTARPPHPGTQAWSSSPTTSPLPRRHSVALLSRDPGPVQLRDDPTHAAARGNAGPALWPESCDLTPTFR